MKSVVCEGHGDEGVLRVSERPAPEMVAGGVRVRVGAAGLNRADLLQRRGLYPPPPGASDILGLECGGTVAETSADVTGFSPGDRVMALVAGGGQAEETVVDRGSLLPVPDAFGPVEAGAFPEVYLTAFLNLFMLGGLDSGMTALVHGGSGGVGTAAIQLANTSGARILVTAGSDERRERCLSVGADHAVNYRDQDFEALCSEVTDGAGVDVVLDCVGGPYLEKNLRVLVTEGRLVVIGLMGGSSAQLDMRRLLSKRIRIIGSTLRALSPERKREIVGSFLDRFGDALNAGRLRPVIDSVFPMERVADAHRRLASGDAFGKVVLTIE
jgi:putative PIG3 family NAD(P)H quinone oxidoreductase